jgi:diguanylate cyclase (GGDEF)-like protein
MNHGSIDLVPFNNFEDASRAVLTFLHQRLGFNLWMMTRTEGSEWIVLQAEDHGYNVEEGSVFRWEDSFCSQMVKGIGPCIAPKAKEIPVYANAPIGQQVPIGAYIGVPINRKDGSLFGTLCAIDPSPQNESICSDRPLIELLAKLLGTLLESDLKGIELTRLLERSQMEALTDELTGLLNRRGWDQHFAAEETRAQRYGTPLCVLIVDLDDLKQINDTQGHAQGDTLITSAAHCLSSAVRESDVVARIGGDEFSILAIECDAPGSDALYKKIADTLSAAGINASIGKSMRDPRFGLTQAIAEADSSMYFAKKKRRILAASRSRAFRAES